MKKYESPELLMIMLSTADVITASNVADDDEGWTDFY